MSEPGGAAVLAFIVILLLINTFLYPYARYVYESLVGFIFGDAVVIGNLIFMFAIKVFAMSVCYCFALFIAPLGLIYLFFHHNRRSG